MHNREWAKFSSDDLFLVETDEMVYKFGPYKNIKCPLILGIYQKQKERVYAQREIVVKYFLNSSE